MDEAEGEAEGDAEREGAAVDDAGAAASERHDDIVVRWREMKGI